MHQSFHQLQQYSSALLIHPLSKTIVLSDYKVAGKALLAYYKLQRFPLLATPYPFVILLVMLGSCDE